MKMQELIISCCFTNEGASVQDIVQSSFAAFLKRELKTFASEASVHV